ncbi:hypothetical protein HPB51_015049 [Rhipicephalus microplus]|uniref:Uncharacterized protein n=1 Tax=Rhipicephalus microplus TaxID=6941 RepID=A0A9J6ETV1_RHIMP|nr:hypothetical protein HPB51_015049 [Rhipicephalus microplus]
MRACVTGDFWLLSKKTEHILVKDDIGEELLLRLQPRLPRPVYKPRGSSVPRLWRPSRVERILLAGEPRTPELSPGELSLVDSYGTRIRYHPGARPLQAHRQAAASLLCHLLTLHHCIVSVNLTNYILETNHEVICDVLYKSTSLKKLKLEPWPFRTSSSRSFTAALPKMNQLQGFDCCDVPLDRATPESLSKFLASTQTLTTLYMSTDSIQDKDAAIIIQGLKRNATLTTLNSLDL